MTDIIDNLISGVSLVKAINEETKNHKGPDGEELPELTEEQQKIEDENTKLKQLGALGSAIGNILGGNYVMAGSMLVRFGSSIAEEELKKEKTNRRKHKCRKHK